MHIEQHMRAMYVQRCFAMLNMTKRRSMQKAPFAFYLSALTFLVIALSFSCSMNPDMQTPGQAAGFGANAKTADQLFAVSYKI
jgi:hypothetical protein